MRALLCLLALLAFGCDDAAVATRAANVLEHGAVQARIDCAWTTAAPLGSVHLKYRAHLFQDGSVLASASGFGHPSGLTYWSRDEDLAPTGEVLFYEGETTSGFLCPRSSGNSIGYADGEVFACWDNLGHADTAAIDEVCTGFNLEAFGVEPP